MSKKRQYGFLTNMSESKLVEYAYELYRRDLTRGELQKKDRGLYNALYRRKLLNNFKTKQRDHKSLSNEELVKYTYDLYGEDITRGELSKKDNGLYSVLHKRKLLNNLKRERRDHKSLSDKELIESIYKQYGRDVTRGELREKDSGLYWVLRKRDLLDKFSNPQSNNLENIIDSYLGDQDD